MLSIQASLLAPREVSVNQAHLSMSTGKKSATNRLVPASNPLAWKAASHAWAAASAPDSMAPAHWRRHELRDLFNFFQA